MKRKIDEVSDTEEGADIRRKRLENGLETTDDEELRFVSNFKQQFFCLFWVSLISSHTCRLFVVAVAVRTTPAVNSRLLFIFQ